MCWCSTGVTHASNQRQPGTALTRPRKNRFRALGVWEALAPHASDMRDIIVTDASGQHEGRPHLLSFDTAADRQAAACIVENGPLNAALLAGGGGFAHIELQGGFRFQSLEATGARVVVNAEDGASRNARLLVAADGRQSPVRTALGISVTRHDYHQTALTFSIMHSQPHHNTAEEALFTRWRVCRTAASGGAASIVWGTSPAHAAELMALDTGPSRPAATPEGTSPRRGEAQGNACAFPLYRQIAKTMIAVAWPCWAMPPMQFIRWPAWSQSRLQGFCRPCGLCCAGRGRGEDIGAPAGAGTL